MVSISYGHGVCWDFPTNFLFSDMVGYIYETSDNGTTTTTVDASFDGLGNGFWTGCYIKYLTGANAGLTRAATDFIEATDTVVHDAFPNPTALGDTFHMSWEWMHSEDGQALAPVSIYNDYLDIEVLSSADNKVGYVTNRTNLGLDTTMYKYLRYRYATTGSAKAKIVVEFNDTTTQTILNQSSSSTMTSATVALTTLQTLDHIRLHADAATGHVYYDFALVYRDDFVFPNAALGIDEYPPVRYADLEIPSRFSDVTQNLGSRNWRCHIGCDLTVGNWKRIVNAITDPVDGQVFYDIAANSGTEPWQWLDLTQTQITDAPRLKVTMRDPRFHRSASGDRFTRTVDLDFQEYRRSSGDNTLESYVTRYGLNL